MSCKRKKLRRDHNNKSSHMEDVFRRSRHEALPNPDDYHSTAAYHHHEGVCKEQVLGKIGSKRAYHESSEDLKSSSLEHDKDFSLTNQVAVANNKKERSPMESDSKASSSSQRTQDSWLESARAEMGEVREENQRLKMYLGQVMKDYQALQMKFYGTVQQEETKKYTSAGDNSHHAVEEHELVSLTLGRFSSESIKDRKSKNCSNGKNDETANDESELSLGLDCKFEVSKSHDGNGESLAKPVSPVNSCEDQPKEEAGDTWPPPKVLNTMPSGADDEAAQQNPLKKARVSVRARCDTPTMSDGCQWRKYGQKIAKGNPCPRAYYRCTGAPSCPVRKQVQRCAEDVSILITTYEGTHNHPLPLSATAMASTTCAAATMLLSGSTRSGPNPSSATSSTTAADLHGLNFYVSDNSNSKQFYLHTSSLSASSSHPTITLDLTSNPSSNKFNRFSSNYAPILKSPPAGFNFSSDKSNAMPWVSGLPSYSRNQLGTSNVSGRTPTESGHFQPFMQQKTPTTLQQPLPDTIAAATKALTADPSFQSALAAAVVSVIGSDGANLGGGDNVAQKFKWGEHFPVASGNSSTPKGNIACATTSYLNKTTSTNSQPAHLMFLPPSLPLPSTKSASASAGDNIDDTN